MATIREEGYKDGVKNHEIKLSFINGNFFSEGIYQHYLNFVPCF
jgi:hypothetical protein